MTTHTCPRCGMEFTSYQKSACFFSLKCKGDAQAPDIDPQEIRRLYESGFSQTEVAKKLGVSQKSIFKAMRRNGIPSRPAIKRNQLKESNDSWKGDEAGYQAFHRRLDAEYGRPKICSICGGDDPSKIYEWANLTGRYEDIGDFRRMCRSCHRKYDNARRRGGDAK